MAEKHGAEHQFWVDDLSRKHAMELKEIVHAQLEERQLMEMRDLKQTHERELQESDKQKSFPCKSKRCIPGINDLLK